MNENYLIIEGIKVPLTDEQVAMIKGAGTLKSKKKSPFSRVEKKESYWLIDIDGTINQTYESGWMISYFLVRIIAQIRN